MAGILSTLALPAMKRITTSERYLASQHNSLAAITSVEQLVTDERLDQSVVAGVTHHILQLRQILARHIWPGEIYVGRSLLDNAILHQAKTGQPGILQRVIGVLDAAGAELPGFVVYPLTGFGMELPFFGLDPALKGEAVFRKAGFAVSTQTNSVGEAIASVQRLARALGIRDRISAQDLRHYAFSARWFGKNPLMIARLMSHTGDMYENQFVYTLKIRLAAAHLLMLSVLSRQAVGEPDRYRTSRGVNNFATLDIAHYFIGEALPGRSIELLRVPMNVSPLDLARLSDVPAMLSTRTLATAPLKRHERSITRALATIEGGYFRHVSISSNSKPEARLFQRLMTAIDWFRQSFSARANEAEAIVAIAVAFETLLTDQYFPGVVKRLQRRIGLCLKGVPGVRDYQDSIQRLYEARGAIVHTGEPKHLVDVAMAQVAFTRCLCAVAERIDAWTSVSSNAMANLLGDIADEAGPSTSAP
jgi:hypothetical protein